MFNKIRRVTGGEHGIITVPKSKGDPKILKRGPNFEGKWDPKFDFFRIVQREYVKIVKKRNENNVFGNKLTVKKLYN